MVDHYLNLARPGPVLIYDPHRTRVVHRGTVDYMVQSQVTVTNRTVTRGIDRVLSVQRPVVLAHIRGIRRGKPNATPAEIIQTLERRYLAAVTTGGAVVGLTAAVPAIGTGTSLVLSGVETAGFLEASALFAQSVTEVHGFVLDDPDRARALVMTMVLGTAGTDLVKQMASQVSGVGVSKTAFWGEMVTKNMPRAVIGPMADSLRKTFLRRFAVAQGTNVVGRLIPFGIGAAIGAGGNNMLGRQIVKTAREGFGPPPATFPEWLAVVEVIPKTPRGLRTFRARSVRRTVRTPGAPRVLVIPIPTFPFRRRGKTPQTPQLPQSPAAPQSPALTEAPPLPGPPLLP